MKSQPGAVDDTAQTAGSTVILGIMALAWVVIGLFDSHSRVGSRRGTIVL